MSNEEKSNDIDSEETSAAEETPAAEETLAAEKTPVAKDAPAGDSEIRSRTYSPTQSDKKVTDVDDSEEAQVEEKVVNINRCAKVVKLSLIHI